MPPRQVFENQRLQPFRGWGHSWPGHFLPTDKVRARHTTPCAGNAVPPCWHGAAHSPALPCPPPPAAQVNHWSRREHENFPVIAGSDFAAIAPPLPQGWQWIEVRGARVGAQGARMLRLQRMILEELSCQAAKLNHPSMPSPRCRRPSGTWT